MMGNERVISVTAGVHTGAQNGDRMVREWCANSDRMVRRMVIEWWYNCVHI